MRVIDQRIHRGEPEKAGKPLSGDLAGCRRIRTGDTRIIYQVNERTLEATILAVGMRRREEVYELALPSQLSGVFRRSWRVGVNKALAINKHFQMCL